MPHSCPHMPGHRDVITPPLYRFFKQNKEQSIPPPSTTRSCVRVLDQDYPLSGLLVPSHFLLSPSTVIADSRPITLLPQTSYVVVLVGAHWSLFFKTSYATVLYSRVTMLVRLWETETCPANNAGRGSILDPLCITYTLVIHWRRMSFNRHL